MLLLLFTGSSAAGSIVSYTLPGPVITNYSSGATVSSYPVATTTITGR